MRSGSAAVVLGVVPGLPAPGCTIGGHTGLDRKTVRRYVEAAQAAGLTREDGVEALDDEVDRGGRRGGAPGATGVVTWRGVGTAATGFEKQISDWVARYRGAAAVDGDKIHTLLAVGVWCRIDVAPLPVSVAVSGRKISRAWSPTDPGIECQLDFGYLGCHRHR